jgi:hypothetical protein
MAGGEETDEQTQDQPDEVDKDGQDYLDRSKLDFDPADGLYTGTAVEGTSDIPGPHEKDGDNEQAEPDGADQ